MHLTCYSGPGLRMRYDSEGKRCYSATGRPTFEAGHPGNVNNYVEVHWLLFNLGDELSLVLGGL